MLRSGAVPCLQIYSTEKSFVVLFPSASELEAWRKDLHRLATRV